MPKLLEEQLLATPLPMGEEAGQQFPSGLRVLVVDDDLTCLTILEKMLLKCGYAVKTCSRATEALSLLRENKGGFHVVISDVHMPDMDGFRLLELVGLEMDLPVIMMSADERTNVVMQGIKHGACDYLIKPVRMEELKNIWQHVFRKKWRDKDFELSGSLDYTDRSRHTADDAEYASSASDGADGSWKSQQKKRNVKEEEDIEMENADPSSSKRPRVVWSVELHQQFVNAVNQLGIDQAVPKRILDLMNVPGLTRENVASHLQKFRLYLKRLSGIPPHYGGLSNSLCVPASSVKPIPLGGLDFRTLAASGQIPPQILAALQDELLDLPSGNVFFPAGNRPSLHTSPQRTKHVPVQREIAFGRPLFKYDTNVPRKFPQTSSPAANMPCVFPSWTSNDHAVNSAVGNFGPSSNSRSGSNIVQMQQQQHEPNLSSSEYAGSFNVQPSCVIIPSEPLNAFQAGKNPMIISQTNFALSPESLTGIQATNPPSSRNQNAAAVPFELSTSLEKLKSRGSTVQNSLMFWSESSANPQATTSITKSSKPAPLQPIVNFKIENCPFQGNENSILFSQRTSSLQDDSVPILLGDNSSYTSRNTVLDYSLPPSQSKNIRFGVGQIVDEGFSNSSVSTSYSVPGLVASPASSCTDGSSGWRGQGASRNSATPSASPSLLPNLWDIQNSTSLSGTLSDQRQWRNLGFVGKGTCIPSRFAADDVESATNNLNQGSIYASEGGEIGDTFGFDGLL